MMRSSVMLLLVLCCSGCTMLYTRVDRPVELKDSMLEAGTTEFGEVLDLLGPPSRVTALPHGFAFLYESLLVRELQIGLSGPSQVEWASLFKITLADANLEHQVVLFHFHSNGRLLSVSSSDSKEDLGMGGTVQLLVAVAPVVETDGYQDDAVAPLEWGLALCRPLPAALNAAQSLQLGAAGLEQAGTSPFIGQHTLEMQ